MNEFFKNIKKVSEKYYIFDLVKLKFKEVEGIPVEIHSKLDTFIYIRKDNNSGYMRIDVIEAVTGTRLAFKSIFEDEQENIEKVKEEVILKARNHIEEFEKMNFLEEILYKTINNITGISPRYSGNIQKEEIKIFEKDDKIRKISIAGYLSFVDGQVVEKETDDTYFFKFNDRISLYNLKSDYNKRCYFYKINNRFESTINNTLDKYFNELLNQRKKLTSYLESIEKDLDNAIKKLSDEELKPIWKLLSELFAQENKINKYINESLGLKFDDEGYLKPKIYTLDGFNLLSEDELKAQYEKVRKKLFNVKSNTEDDNKYNAEDNEIKEIENKKIEKEVKKDNIEDKTEYKVNDDGQLSLF